MEDVIDSASPAQHHSDAGDRQRVQRSGLLAAVLLTLGLVFVVLYAIENSREHHSYSAGAKAPFLVHVTNGNQYEISITGGVKRLASLGIEPAALACTYSTSTAGDAGQKLDVTALGADTRTVHAIATFSAPVTGQIHLACSGVPSVFVDDADNVSADPAGLFILLATISLVSGAAFALSALYRRPPREPVRRARQREQEAYFGHLLTPEADQDGGVDRSG